MNADQVRAIIVILNTVAVTSLIGNLVRSDRNRALNGTLLTLNLASVVWLISRIGN